MANNCSVGVYNYTNVCSVLQPLDIGMGYLLDSIHQSVGYERKISLSHMSFMTIVGRIYCMVNHSSTSLMYFNLGFSVLPVYGKYP